MSELITRIDNIITDINNQINDKILGVNYLEKFKYLLIDQLKNYKIPSFQDISNNETLKDFPNHEMVISIKKYIDSSSKIKSPLEKDCLSVVLKGAKVIEIHNNENDIKTKSLNLFKYTGLVLSKGTLASESISKESIILDIYLNKNVVDNEN